MSAKPSIVIGASTGYVVDSDTIVLMCLYENKTTLGMVKLQGSKYDAGGNVCYQDLSQGYIDIQCAPTTAYNLKNLGSPVVHGQGIFDFACLESFGCSAGDNCNGLICTTWGPRISFETRIPIREKNTAFPLAPTGLNITPRSGELALAWNIVNDPTGGEVFAYNVKVFDGTIPIIDGYTEAGLRNITIGGLTNGREYSIHIDAINHNGYISLSSAIGSGTPIQGAIGSINFVSNPTGAEILLNGSDQKHITPYTITGVPVGTHSYKLTLLNHPDITGNVTVQENKIAQVSADFTTWQANIVALVVGVGVAAVLIGGLYYVIKKPETTRTTDIMGR
jgi:hypothetical protein